MTIPVLQIAVLSALLFTDGSMNAGQGWVRSWHEQGGAAADCLCVDSNNNVYFSYGTGWASVVTKLSSEGIRQWEYPITSSSSGGVTQMVMDGSGNIYILGGFHCGVTLGSGADAITYSAEKAFDIFLCKITNSGKLEWARILGGYDFGFGPRHTVPTPGQSIALNASGDIFICGTIGGVNADAPGPTQEPGMPVSAFLWRLDSDGEFVWKRAWNSVKAYSVAVDDSEAVYLVGSYWGSFGSRSYTGDLTLVSKGSSDALECRFDLDGNLVWATSWGGSEDDAAIAVALDGQGSVYVSGDLGGSADFGPDLGSVETAATGLSDCFLVRLSTCGQPAWVRTWSGPYWESHNAPATVLADGAGNVYVAGTNFCVFPWDDIQNYQPCVIKAFVRSYDSLGELEWERTLGENESSKSHPGWCEAYDIALDDAGSLFVAGAFYGVVDLAPGSDGDHHLAMNRWDAFLLKTPLPPQ